MGLAAGSSSGNSDFPLGFSVDSQLQQLQLLQHLLTTDPFMQQRISTLSLLMPEWFSHQFSMPAQSQVGSPLGFPASELSLPMDCDGDASLSQSATVSVSSDGTFICPLCTSVSKQHRELQRHIVRSHPNEAPKFVPYACYEPKCGVPFADAHNLTKHNHLQHTAKYPEPPPARARPILSANPQPKPVRLETCCGYAFKGRNDNYKRHMNTVHKGTLFGLLAHMHSVLSICL